jgi:hypothetical protein
MLVNRMSKAMESFATSSNFDLMVGMRNITRIRRQGTTDITVDAKSVSLVVSLRCLHI